MRFKKKVLWLKLTGAHEKPSTNLPQLELRLVGVINPMSVTERFLQPLWCTPEGLDSDYKI